MTRPPALQAAAGAMAARSTETDRCPKCGCPLEFTSDMHGYGRTIEQCVKRHCDHWRPLETIIQPAHTPPPREDRERVVTDAGTRPYRRRNQSGGLRAAILAALPTKSSKALSPRAIAEASGQDLKIVHARLGQLANAGEIQRRREGRSAFYWRAA